MPDCSSNWLACHSMAASKSGVTATALQDGQRSRWRLKNRRRCWSLKKSPAPVVVLGQDKITTAQNPLNGEKPPFADGQLPYNWTCPFLMEIGRYQGATNYGISTMARHAGDASWSAAAERSDDAALGMARAKEESPKICKSPMHQKRCHSHRSPRRQALFDAV